MQYISISTMNELHSEIIIINFLNIEEKDFNNLKDCKFGDTVFTNIYKTIDEFYNKEWFNKYFKESFNMSDSQVSMFHELLTEIKNLIDKFSVSKISLYNYIMKTDELRKTWNEAYPQYPIDGFTESSFKMNHIKYMKRICVNNYI